MYLTLPDVRALATTNPADDGVHGAARARSRAARAARSGASSVGSLHAHLEEPASGRCSWPKTTRFFEHEGVDLEELKKSIEHRPASAAGPSAARSTITQQLAKNLYLSPSRNPLRKLRELIITRRLEAALPKARIFEIYLNVIEWGDGIWGAEAAARTYFGVSAASLVPRAGGAARRRDHQSARAQRRASAARLLGRQQHHPRPHGSVEPPSAGAQPAQTAQGC